MAVIFYFSGTGNSLDVAKQVKSVLTDCRLENIAKYERAPYEVTDEVVGIVFPVYMFDAPKVVQKFLTKLQAPKANYIFSIATMGSHAGRALANVQETLAKNGLKLSYANAIAMPDNSFIRKPELAAEKLTIADKNIDRTVTHIAKRREDTSQCIDSSFLKYVGIPLGFFVAAGLMGMYEPKLTKQDCIGCANCARLCPVQNIKMQNGFPVFNGKCEACVACVRWCPRHAITIGGGLADSKKRNYTNPNIKMKELFNNEEV